MQPAQPVLGKRAPHETGSQNSENKRQRMPSQPAAPSAVVFLHNAPSGFTETEVSGVCFLKIE